MRAVCSVTEGVPHDMDDTKVHTRFGRTCPERKPKVLDAESHSQLFHRRSPRFAIRMPNRRLLTASLCSLG
jgi:hypothetical protein